MLMLVLPSRMFQTIHTIEFSIWRLGFGHTICIKEQCISLLNLDRSVDIVSSEATPAAYHFFQ